MSQSPQKILRIFTFVLSLVCVFYLVPAQADERILRFVSDIYIHADASADISETIEVVAEQQKIRHGIYRLLLSYFQDDAGLSHRLTYQVQQVFVDSYPSPFYLQYQPQGLTIYVGSKDKLLDPGTYTYLIQYHADNVVTFLQDRDEFYWNITGNYWQFPIEAVEANIYLPEGAHILNSKAYTGAIGMKGQDLSSSSFAPNEITYTTTRSLMPGEGLTIAFDWPKGIVHQPTLIEKSRGVLIDSQSNFIAFQIMILLMIYYSYVWYCEGREPPQGSIIPLFEPPAGLSPAGMRFIANMGFDMKTFSTAISLLLVHLKKHKKYADCT